MRKKPLDHLRLSLEDGMGKNLGFGSMFSFGIGFSWDLRTGQSMGASSRWERSMEIPDVGIIHVWNKNA